MSIDREINRKFLNLQFFCNRTMINSSEYHKSSLCIVIILTPLTWADMYIFNLFILILEPYSKVRGFSKQDSFSASTVKFVYL